MKIALSLALCLPLVGLFFMTSGWFVVWEISWWWEWDIFTRLTWLVFTLIFGVVATLVWRL